MGRGFQADAMRDHLAGVKKQIVDKSSHDHVLKELALDGVFSHQEAEKTNPFNLSSEQILEVATEKMQSSYHKKAVVSEPSSSLESQLELDLSREGQKPAKGSGPRDEQGSSEWNFQADLYKDGVNETAFFESATLDLDEPMKKSTIEKVVSDIDDGIVKSEDPKGKIDLFSEESVQAHVAEDDLAEDASGQQPEFDLFSSPKARQRDENEQNKEKSRLPLNGGGQASSSAESSYQPSRAVASHSEEFENLKKANFKSYDAAVLSQMFEYYFDKNQLSRAKEIIESTAAFCSSEKWWKDSFDKLLEARSSGKQLYYGLLDSQVGLYEAEDLIKSYQMDGDLSPWASLSRKVDSVKAIGYLEELQENYALLQKDRFFLFYLDLAIITGYSRLVLKELASRERNYEEIENRKSVFIRWQHAHELLNFEVDLSDWAKESSMPVTDIIKDMGSKKFEELLRTRMNPSFLNYKL
jgi:hypothetical protein